jgi:aryl-alcohol dehydrogenase-like predicted oxidoreductase
VQLHCPPTPVFSDPSVFAALEAIKAKGKIADYGVSVETVEEARAAIRQPGVVSVQIIYNMFRMKPAEVFFPEAKAANVAVIARVPLASGLLTGKMTKESQFAADDHRSFNRNGEAFDKGETFSGVPYEVALEAVEELRALVPAGVTMAAFSLRWILMEEAVTVVIPGAKSPAQARANAVAAGLPGLSPAVMEAAREVYDRRIKAHVHGAW